MSQVRAFIRSNFHNGKTTRSGCANLFNQQTDLYRADGCNDHHSGEDEGVRVTSVLRRSHSRFVRPLLTVATLLGRCWMVCNIYTGKATAI